MDATANVDSYPRPTMSKAGVLEQYKGSLTTAQAAAGIKAAIQNSCALLEEAKLLANNGRWQRSAALAILAIEESGKVSILRGILLARNEQELKESWREYRNHSSKNRASILPDLVAKGARKFDELRLIVDGSSDHNAVIEAVKQISVYSDALGQCHWSVPSEVVSQELSEQLLNIARILVQTEESAFTTEAELNIWVKHMRPVWKKDMNAMKGALLSCYAEARTSGVLQGKQTESDMLEFLFSESGQVS
jgi:AbiV family abortive infection protein